ncbi:MAG: hypothetical protein ACOYXC_20855 [Candidatus Rifleibacteriota bacterium]
MDRRKKLELFEIRREFLQGGQSIRSISAKYQVHRRMVRQAIAGAIPPITEMEGFKGMNKRMSITIFLIFLIFFSIALPSYSVSLRLEIVASSFEKSGLNHLKIDYKVSSKTDIILKPFSYGWIPTSGWMGSALAFESDNTLHFCVNETGIVYPNSLLYCGAKKAIESTLYSDPSANHPRYFSMAAKSYKTNNK